MILADFSDFLGSLWFAGLCLCVGVGLGVYACKRGIVK
jgi:hypothetical protein